MLRVQEKDMEQQDIDADACYGLRRRA